MAVWGNKSSPESCHLAVHVCHCVMGNIIRQLLNKISLALTYMLQVKYLGKSEVDRFLNNTFVSKMRSTRQIVDVKSLRHCGNILMPTTRTLTSFLFFCVCHLWHTSAQNSCSKLWYCCVLGSARSLLYWRFCSTDTPSMTMLVTSASRQSVETRVKGQTNEQCLFFPGLIYR